MVERMNIRDEATQTLIVQYFSKTYEDTHTFPIKFSRIKGKILRQIFNSWIRIGNASYLETIST